MHQASDKSLLICLNHQENSQYSLLFNLHFYSSCTVGKQNIFNSMTQKTIQANEVDFHIVERLVHEKNDAVPYFL